MESTKRLNATKYGYMPCSITIKVREPGAAFTHLAGLLGVLVGAGPLLMRAREFGSAFTYAGMIIFILSALILYGASTSFHWIVAGERVTNVFRKLDHMSISILIAGTYTSVCLTALRGRGGHIMLAAIWGLAISSMIIKAFWYYCPKWISSSIYIGMGWLAIFFLPTIVRSLPLCAFLWLLIGGIMYTIGGVIYALKLQVFNEKHIHFGTHEIFHLFVMAGTLCHFMLLYRYLVFVG
jgi:hemolysin III